MFTEVIEPRKENNRVLENTTFKLPYEKVYDVHLRLIFTTCVSIHGKSLTVNQSRAGKYKEQVSVNHHPENT